MDGIIIALNREVLHTVNLEAQLAEANERIAQLSDENQVLRTALGEKAPVEEAATDTASPTGRSDCAGSNGIAVLGIHSS